MPETPPIRFAYFGPEATFTEAALRTLPAARTATLEPHPTVPGALDAVRRGAADAAMVPLENSVEGSVSTTLDELADLDREALQITSEVLLPVSFALLVRPGTTRAEVRHVATHAHAQAQCRRWFARELPDAQVHAAGSTAEAARLVAAGEGGYDAAVSAPLAAQRYGLAVLADNIGDNPDAVTRFVLVGRPAAPPAPTGADRSTVVLYEADDHPGALLEILSEFAVRGVNLTRIESRPTGGGLGSYCFSVDCEGHVADARVGEALTALHRVCAEVRFLGSYPRADGRAPVVRRGTSDAAFGAAQAWLARLREGR